MSGLQNASAQILTDPQFTFKSMDYTVFGIVLTMSASIGVYFGFIHKGADTTDEYLMGGKRMKILPIAISLVASQLSAIAIMSVPAEMYAFGINWSGNVICTALVIPIINYIIIPVLYNNNITNVNEYLELRFNAATRKLITFVYVLSLTLLLPIYIFLPSLAFAQVTGFNVHIINIVVSSICVFYTMIVRTFLIPIRDGSWNGGIKAVVWTDVVQAGIMVISVVLVATIGIFRIGGVGEVLRIASEGGRLEFDFTFDHKTRATFWNSIATGTVAWTSYVGLNQSCVQRIVALPSLKHANRAILLYGLGFIFIMFFNCLTGVVMYTYYYNCDPLILGQVSKLDKMMPYFVQDIIGHLTGMPGIFISCVFSAALSTLSASINALAGVVYFDYIKPHIHHTDHKANVCMKLFVLSCGVYCILGGIVVENFSSILQIVFSIGGVSFGGICAVFLLGMLLPKAHSRAVLPALITSYSVMIFIVVGSWGRNRYEHLPTSVDHCPEGNVTTTTTISSIPIQAESTTVMAKDLSDSAFNLFDLSFNWYATVGFVIAWVVGMTLSYLLKPAASDKLDPKLLSPVIKSFVKYDLAPVEELTDLKVNIKKEVLE